MYFLINIVGGLMVKEITKLIKYIGTISQIHTFYIIQLMVRITQ